MANNVKIQAGQTIPDIAMQQSGSVEAMFALALLNGVSVTAGLPIGSLLNYDPVPVNPVVFKIYRDGSYMPASEVYVSGQATPENGGIGTWKVELDFKVS